MDDTHDRWAEQVGAACTAVQVADLLDATTDQVEAHPGLLRLEQADGRHVYPAVQFDDHGQLPGVADIVRTLTPAVATTWTIAAWITTPNAQLDGRRPVDACAHGQDDAVVTVARQWADALTR